MVEPADVSVTIGGKPYNGVRSVDLEAGVHEIELRKDGYKTRVATIELSANETFGLMVTLERAPRRIGRSIAGTGPDDLATANLILSSTPAGLDVYIDGVNSGEKTPMHRMITAGPHIVTMRQNGVEVWRQRLVAEADSEHEFTPSFTVEKLRERRERQKAQATAHVEQTPAPTGEVAQPPVAETEVAASTTKPEAPVPPPPTTTESPKPAIVEPKPVQPPPQTVARPQTGPVTVAPTAVKKLSGDTPTLGTSRPDQVPSVVAARVCIDTSGRVTSVDMISKLERHTASDLASAIKTWKYAPYHKDGQPTPACFSVNFRVK